MKTWRAGRWPVNSIALVLLNVVFSSPLAGKSTQKIPLRTQVRAHILLLAGEPPELTLPRMLSMVTTFKKNIRVTGAKRNRRHATWRMPGMPGCADLRNPAALQQEMDSLAEQWAGLEKGAFLEQYAFVRRIRAP